LKGLEPREEYLPRKLSFDVDVYRVDLDLRSEYFALAKNPYLWN